MTYQKRREKINEAVEEANKAFWEVIQKHFPEHKGELNPYLQVAFQREQKEAVASWLLATRLSEEG
jgi:hypothetical protein